MSTKQATFKRLSVLGILPMVVLGSLAHFTYDWSGQNSIVGLFSAMNESVWEHSKLFILPLAVWTWVEYRVTRNLAGILFAKVFQFVVMSLFITAFFYTYTGAMGVEEQVLVDIASFVIAIVLGQYLSYRLLSSNHRRYPRPFVSIGLLLAMWVLFVYFSFEPPAWPLFQSAV